MLILSGKDRRDNEPYMVKDTTPKVLDANSKQINIFFSLLGVAFVGVVGMGFIKQINNHVDYQKASDNRIERSIKSPALTGAILDRNGEELAMSRYYYVAEFNPQQLREAINKGQVVVGQKSRNKKYINDEKLHQLANILGVSEADINERLNKTSSTREVFDIKLSVEQYNALEALKFPGLFLVEKTERVYPAGKQFAHLLGFVNKEGRGQGLEFVHKTDLAGKDGYQSVYHDYAGNVVRFLNSEKNTPKEDGKPLSLSVDSRIQYMAYNALGKAMQKHQAKAGGVVVLDAQTGEILSMVSMPDYDPAFYNEYPQEVLSNNFAVSAVMDQGSTMKPFIVAKAIDDGKVTPDTVINTQSYVVAGNPIRDDHSYSSLTIEGVLQKSSNIGTAKLAELYDSKTLYQYYDAAGFGKKTQSGVTGERFVPLLPLSKWKALDKAKMAYGYTMSSNLLQVAQAYTIFTTDGRLMPATIYKQTSKPKGEQVIQPRTAHKMRQMLTSVVEKGTGKQAAIEGYSVAGKTGTAQKYIINRGYDNTKHLASFVGFAPATNPRLIVAVSIDEPKNDFYGGTVAAPVFQEVMAGSLDYLGVETAKEDVNELAAR